MRSYMPPISRASPGPNPSAVPNAPHPARSASGYPPSSLPAHSQSSYPAAHAMAPNAGSSQSTTAGTSALPSISGTYPRSPTFSSTQTSAIPPIKSGMQQPGSNHPASSPLPGQSAAAHDEPAARTAAYGSPPAAHSQMPRMPPPQSMSSPGARPVAGNQALPMQSPHPHQNTASVPPLKQMQSPRTHRAISAQSTPLPPHAQQSPRATAVGNAPHASTTGPSAGSTFATTPKSSLMPASMATLASTAVPPLGSSHNMGTVARAAPAPATGHPQSSGLAISGPQSSAAGAASITASAPASAGVGGNTEHAHARQQQQQSQTQPDASGRPLNVTDALSYLDMVKSQFQDRPEVYNQFLEIMKEFKSHAIDTPGVINRVSRLFFGSQSLIQGFNTFLPPGYRIECSDDPAEGVRVTTPSGSIIPDMNRQIGVPVSMGGQNNPQSPQNTSLQPIAQRGPQQQQQQHYGARDQYAARRTGPQGPMASGTSAQSGQGMQAPVSQTMTSGAMAAQGGAYPATTTPGPAGGPMSARSPSAVRSPSLTASQRSRQVPVEFNHAITYVNKIKMRFAAEPDRYKEFLEILQTYQKESRPIQEVYSQVQHLFLSAPDLLDEFKQFLPDTSDSSVSELAAFGSTSAAYARVGQTSAAGSGVAQGQHSQAGPSSQHGMGGADAMAGGRLPPLGNFAPAGGAAGQSADPFAAGSTGAPISAAAGTAQTAGMAYDMKGPGTTPGGSRKRRGVMSCAQGPGAGSAKRRSRSAKAEGVMGDGASGYGQLLTAAQQQAANPATATPEELAFFERVKRFIGQPNAYNEFLKLLNLYNQQVLDPRTLVERAESFIGDDSELFGWFKQFVGFDEQQTELEDNRSGDEDVIESILGPEPRPYMPPEEVAKTLRATRPKVSLAQCKSYGPSYRLLPDASTKAKCSGRDAMCYEVLNDRWASHPTWASEDTEFVHHKKNQFEEAMFRSEEDRHEMDIEIDTNLSVIRQLTPFAQQIEQMGADRQTQVVLPENFLGMSEALPRRALRKVYDSNRALEIIKAMHTHPVVAIPIVLKRLKQKDEEWRRQRREYAKIWRESDSKNYYRALDHQGLTFKSADRKNISPKHFITEIETRRREQQNLMPDEASGSARAQNRKVTSALRHRYQLEYRFSESTVIADVINAILAHVGRQNSQFAPAEKEMMERFFHELFGGLLGIESPDHSQSVSDNEESLSDEDVETGEAEKTSPDTPAVNGHASNGNANSTKEEEPSEGDNAATADTEAAAAAVADTPTDAKDAKDALPEVASDDAMDVDKTNGDAKESDAPDADKAETKDSDNGADGADTAASKPATANGQVNGSAKSPRAEEGSKPSTPGLISSRSWIQIGSAARDPSAAPSIGTTAKSVSRAFYTNSSYYVFLRLFQVLYERFNRLRELGPECQAKVIQAHQSQSVATKLGLRPELDVLKPYDLEQTEYYSIFLELVDQFLQGQLETNSFDEAMRVMYGINAYKILTVDKVVQAISKSIQHLINDTRCIDILELFTTLPPVHEQSPLRSHIAYRMKVEALVGADEHVFRVDYIYDSQTMTIQLLRREDITLDEAVTEEERWAYYVDSYVLFEPTEGVPQLLQLRPRPYLRRHLHADECDYVISSRSNLEIKIAVNTYKLCFLTGTEDIYANHTRRAQLATDKAAQSACKERWATRTQKWHEWLQNEHQQRLGDVRDNSEEQPEQLSEWWK
ncbi:hypothetical protein H4R20_001441 [Coemansia guatemalensis]|uniref:Histone deacetylase interacting domain-containing protein n=1 Tax=Coemansia guatemalensis TaxID=2761395 RepID=A0A9W8LUX7_9FUNG|nr:hypothetical protein H4R20_001441 [Coemansia guatemalensis]